MNPEPPHDLTVQDFFDVYKPDVAGFTFFDFRDETEADLIQARANIILAGRNPVAKDILLLDTVVIMATDETVDGRLANFFRFPVYGAERKHFIACREDSFARVYNWFDKEAAGVRQLRLNCVGVIAVIIDLQSHPWPYDQGLKAVDICFEEEADAVYYKMMQDANAVNHA